MKVFILIVTAIAMSLSVSGQRRVTKSQLRRQFLDMFARAYVPGRTAQLMIVPREGNFITRADPDNLFMHGSPWSYDVSIPLFFVGPAIKQGVYVAPAVQQDVAVTLAAALGVRMPSTATGHLLPVLKKSFGRPRLIVLLVLDGMRRDYFDKYSSSMPSFSSLRSRSAWFSQARVNFLPTNTAVGHSTISTGTNPSVHGVTGVTVYDRVKRTRRDLFADRSPRDLMSLTLSDVWQLSTAGRAIILAQGSIDRAATPLAGHGACQVRGTAVVLASYDQLTGKWASNADCYRLPEYLKDQNAKSLWAIDKQWMGHRIDSPSAVRYSGLFPVFEADAIAAMIEHEPVGEDDIPDLVLINFKGADFAGHKYGPDSNELRLTLAEMDRQLSRILTLLEKKVGTNYLLAVTADHGMPDPPSPDGRHLTTTISEMIHKRFDAAAKLVTNFEPENSQIFVDEDRLAHLRLKMDDVARFLESQPFIFAAYTNDEVQNAASKLPSR